MFIRGLVSVCMDHGQGINVRTLITIGSVFSSRVSFGTILDTDLYCKGL